ncbi:HlyD family secretion protein [Bradyrhizobium sp. 2TAF24]|uniref:HlyD family secretion protein n=1 Tax=Bradyrhizobium sp. 2TAF24 TaxID=3233011 RepID=UPI003F8FF429
MAAGRDQTARIVRPDSDVAPFDPHASTRPQAEARQDAAPDRNTPAPAAEAPVAAAAAVQAAPAAPNRRRLVLMGIAAVLAIAAVSYGSYYALVGRFIVTTDDAYVRANNTLIGARVAGHIARIAPKDNSRVRAGDVLIKIDDGDYKIAADSARAKIATQEATIARIGRQADAQVSMVEQARAQLESSQAAAKRAQFDFDRQLQLSDKGFASKATFEQSQATRDQSVAAVQSAQAALVAAERNVDVIKAQQVEAQRQLGELQTSLAKAERDLAFTEVRAPVDGTFSNRLVNEGDYIQVGQRLANVVPLDDVFIDANFKETQLGRLKPGQPVSLTVDGVSGRKIEGTVESLSPASGSVFTLLPPDNATGNFTKIVQRVPVRIRVPANVARENLLRAGMSVVVHIDTRAAD